jgi:hypothetical protein
MGLSDRVRFVQIDVTRGIPERFDLITTFNSLHDMVDIPAALDAIRHSLAPQGTWLILECACSDKVEENIGPMGTILYGTSLLYNTAVSVANGGHGEGAMGLPACRVFELCAAAGFSVRRLPIPNPMFALFEAKSRQL